MNYFKYDLSIGDNIKTTCRLFLGFSLVLMITSLLYPSITFGYKPAVHEKITSYAINNSSLELDDVLPQIGFNGGVDQIININKLRSIRQWIEYGSKWEDDLGFHYMFYIGLLSKQGILYNHFFNPLYNIGYYELENDVRVEKGESLIFHMNNYIVNDAYWWQNNEWAYQMARELYYAALTGDSSKFQSWPMRDRLLKPFWDPIAGKINMPHSEREQFFAWTFQALGHIAHLIQDASVPAHTRNDLHADKRISWAIKGNPEPFEIWTAENIESKELMQYEGDGSNSWQNWKNYPDIPAQKAFIDTKPYPENSPTADPIIQSEGFDQGLAEYSFANFFSKDSMESYDLPDKDGHVFLQSEQIYGLSRYFTYLKSKNFDNGGVEHLALCGFMYFLVDPTGLSSESYGETVFTVDDPKVNKDYAAKLVPRAVGYSAGFLDYFFRGTIEITFPDPLAGVNSSSGIEGFDHITLFAKNTSPEGEILSGGTIHLVVKHRVAPTDEFQYIVKAIEGIYSIPSVPDEASGPIEIQFDLSDTPIPVNAKEVYLYLVYRGQLGQENDAVAVGFSDISRAGLEINEPDGFIYSIIDGSVNPHEFTYVKAKLKNTTGEQLLNGAIQAVARYRKRLDYQADLSADPPLSTSREDDFSYSTSALIAMPLFGADTAPEFVFDFSADPIPVGITDLHFHVVYKGKIGAEQNDVTAVGIKDLNEPMHIGMFNSTDRFYLEGELWTASDIRNSPDLLARVDFNGDGQVNDRDGEPYIDPIDIDYYISFYPAAGNTPTMAHAAYEPLAPGKHGKIIILTDAPEFNVSIEIVMITDNYYYPYQGIGTLGGVINQQQGDSLFYATLVYPYRGIIQHFYDLFVNCYPDCAGAYQAPWPELSIKQPVAVTYMNP